MAMLKEDEFTSSNDILASDQTFRTIRKTRNILCNIADSVMILKKKSLKIRDYKHSMFY
jgi:hypothetical protein